MKNWTLIAGICASTMFALPSYAKTTKEYALDYCKEYEASNGETQGLIRTDRWFGQEKNRFYDWDQCVSTKTKEWAVAEDASKAEYRPSAENVAYATKFCSKEYKNQNVTWYGRLPEAEQPHRGVSNSNIYLDKDECIRQETEEAYYATTVLSQAPYEQISNEERARMYCTPTTNPNNGKKGYGAGITTYDSEEECLTDRIKWHDKHDADIAAARAKGNIMQPYATDGKTSLTVKAANQQKSNSSNSPSNVLKDKLKINEDECAIWLCLPSGFPPGCEKAKAAMKKRVRRGHSALPPFGACAVGEDGDKGEFSTAERYVIKIKDANSERIVPATTCREPGTGTGDRDYIFGCQGVYRETQVLHNGKPLGVTHYEFIRSR